MSLGGILVLVLMIVSLFVFIYLMVITAKSWGALHTTMLCFIFVESWIFLLFAGRALDKRVTLLKDYSTTKANVEKLTKEVQKLTWGGENISEAQEAFVPLSGLARRLAADRGRVWRDVTKMGVDGNKIKLELVPPAPVAAAGEEPAAQGAAPAAPVDTIPQNMIVYAFTQGVPNAAPAAPVAAPAPAEAASPADGAATDQAQTPAEPAPAVAETPAGEPTGTSVPLVYIGEFQVVESTPGNVVVSPVTPLEPDQIQALNDENTLSLYETLPQDSHDAFLVKGATPSDQSLFGMVDEAKLNALFASLPADRREALIKNYTRDGGVPTDNDPKLNVYQLVEVAKALKKDVDGGKVNLAEQGYFDPAGRTIDSRLMLGGDQKEVTLAEGKQLLLPQGPETAELIQKGDLKLIRNVYVRPLNAYEKGIVRLKSHRAEVNRLLDMSNREADLLQRANASALAVRENYVKLQGQLTSDIEKYKFEMGLLDKEIAGITKQVESTRKEMLDYWNAIHAAHDSLVGK